MLKWDIRYPFAGLKQHSHLCQCWWQRRYPLIMQCGKRGGNQTGIWPLRQFCTSHLLNRDDRLPKHKEQAAPAAPRLLRSCEMPKHLPMQQGERLTSHPVW